MVNTLEHLDEFEAILKHYHIAPAGQDVLKNVRLALMVGPSAAGRDSISKELLKTGHFYFIVSDTTRKPRINNGVLEQNGVEYWFRTEKEFLADLRAGKLLEAEIIHNQQVSGMSIRELKKALEQDKTAITNVDLNIDAIVSVKPDTLALMVLPPSFEEWMRRLNSRGQMPEIEVRRRLETARRMFKAGAEKPYYTFIINDDLHRSAEVIYKLAVDGVRDVREHDKGRRLVERLLDETVSHLETF